MKEDPMCKNHLGKSLVTNICENLKFWITCLPSSHRKGVHIPALHFYYEVYFEIMKLILLF